MISPRKSAGTEVSSSFPLYTHNGTVYCGILAAHPELDASDTLLCVGERRLCAVAGYMEGSWPCERFSLPTAATASTQSY